MKILEIVTSTSPSKVYGQNASRRGSGYDFITFEIAKNLAKIEDNNVDLFTVVQFHKFLKCEEVSLLENSRTSILAHFSVRLFMLSFFKLFRYLGFNKFAVRDVLYESIISGVYQWIIKNGNYDVIHVHGSIFSNEILKYVADQHNVPIMFTLHGLNSTSSSTRTYSSNRRYEIDFLRRCHIEGRTVTFVSSGCVRSVQKMLNVVHTPSFKTTINGCDIPNNDFNEFFDIREKYGLSSDSYILLYVGNISKNKNQVAAIDSFSLLRTDLKNKTFIFFLGGVHSEYKEEWKRKLSMTPFENHFIECGFVPKNEIHNYYEQADGNILVSIVEGFGLSIIESMAYGLPSIVDQNMDVLTDIDDEKCIVVVDRTSPVSLSNGIEKMHDTTWDGQYLKQKATHYSMENMAANYDSVLRHLLNSKI